MRVTKDIVDIISIQNSCKELIQELYTYESLPNDILRQNYKNAKIDDALRVEILEYDSYDDELSLSADTYDYYKARLGLNEETNISFIIQKLKNLDILLKTYNIRIKQSQNTDSDIKAIYKILSQLPSLLKYNLQAITSTSIFAFKNEPNFDIKIINLNVCLDDINHLINASKSIDDMVKKQNIFFKSMNNTKINTAILKLKRNSVEIESSFRKLYEDIKNFINQSIKDGKFIEKIKKLKELKDKSTLFSDTNIEELAKVKPQMMTLVREKRLHPDDRIHDYIDLIQTIVSTRKIEIINTKNSSDIEYDIEEKSTIKKVLYDYTKLHQGFLAQEKDLISFLKEQNIEPSRLLGVFVRMLKNYSPYYNTDSENFIQINNREFAEILKDKR